MSNIIKLANSDKFFLADYTSMQPIEPIYAQCFQQFGLNVPAWSTPKLHTIIDDKKVILNPNDYNKRFGDYKIPQDAELVFEP